MTIPLDNLYHYIDGLFSEPVCMYLFYPHGSRNILDLRGVKPFDRVPFGLDTNVLPQIICNDQEPLNYNLYQQLPNTVIELFEKTNNPFFSNLKTRLPVNLHDKTMLLHSEQNSPDLELYKKDNYIDIYYWCHAFISKDWYRYAQYDKQLLNNSHPEKDFLIYCRDWSGSREYRLKFQELLFNENLLEHSITSIKKINSDNISVDDAVFINKDFAVENINFLSYVPENMVDSDSSASYSSDDIKKTKINIVLETVFDGTKIHLTEKIFRPIACGQPFMLAAGPGSLEYLKSYGFRTFNPWIDESYDNEQNSAVRLKKIISAMKAFSVLSDKDKKSIYLEIKKIADYNKQWFFSEQFSNKVNTELNENINAALNKVKKTRAWIYRQSAKKYGVEIDRAKKEKRKLMALYLKNIKRNNPISK